MAKDDRFPEEIEVMNEEKKKKGRVTMCEVLDKVEGRGIQKGIELERVHTEEERIKAEEQRKRADAAEMRADELQKEVERLQKLLAKPE